MISILLIVLNLFLSCFIIRKPGFDLNNFAKKALLGTFYLSVYFRALLEYLFFQEVSGLHDVGFIIVNSAFLVLQALLVIPVLNPSYLDKQELKLNRINLKMAFFVCISLVACLVTFMYLTWDGSLSSKRLLGEESRFNNFKYLFYKVSMLSKYFLVAIFIFFPSHSKNRKYQFLLFFIIFIFVLQCFYMSVRAQLLPVFLTALFILWKSEIISFRKIIVLIIIVGLGLVSLTVSRAYGTDKNFMIRLKQNFVHGHYLFDHQRVSKIYEFSENEKLYGQTYFYTFYPIGKMSNGQRVIDMGKYLGERAHNKKRAGVPMGSIGEGVINFGFLGITIVVAIYFLFIKAFCKLYNLTNNPKYRVLLIYLLCEFILVYTNNDFATFIYRGIQALIFISIFDFLLTIGRSKDVTSDLKSAE